MRLERRVGVLVHQVHLQASRYNRADECVRVGTMLNVRDGVLRKWRRGNPESVVPPADDFVCGHLLGYASGRAGGYLYGDASDGDIDLTDLRMRRQRLEIFADMFRQAVLPWFDEASDPERVATSRAGDYTNRPSALVEWLASRDRVAQIGTYVHRYLARTPSAQQRYEAGRAKGEAGLPHAELQGGDMAEELGWSVAKLTPLAIGARSAA
ncbi:hypothetical protein GCM10010435_72790 [Winogradskya consettensis]|uniref:Uncharacterized protein n=2 Tax=Winogradskya consettensis TaxID=113560 RepID=A0A919W0C5_9ACTN|nr:hypothetical protein Aco04nite_87680 [Actinoplanes consettensis]